jgi:signal peptidase I
MALILSFILMILPPASPGGPQTQKTAATESMEPAIQAKDLLTVDETFYSTKPVKRFDVIVVERTTGNGNQTTQSLTVVARVIAMGGETVRIKNNKVFINGVALKEPYQIKPCSPPQDASEKEPFPCANFGPLKIPAGEFLLLADNRGGSEDGRLWKPHTVKKAQIKGKVIKVTRNL